MAFRPITITKRIDIILKNIIHIVDQLVGNGVPLVNALKTYFHHASDTCLTKRVRQTLARRIAKAYGIPASTFRRLIRKGRHTYTSVFSTASILNKTKVQLLKTKRFGKTDRHWALKNPRKSRKPSDGS